MSNTKDDALLSNGMIKLNIGEGKDIRVEIPTDPSSLFSIPDSSLSTNQLDSNASKDKKLADFVRYTLKNYSFPVSDVILGDKTSLENGILTLRSSSINEALEVNDLVTEVTIDIIRPEKQDVYVNTMMDVQPIAVKKEGELGQGVTFEMTNVYMLLTGTDEDGLQTAEANLSCGIYENNVCWDRPGSPEKDAFIIHVNATIKSGSGMERPGPLASHQAMDVITQEIRDVLKTKEIGDAAEERIYKDITRKGKPKVLLVKEIMGQGAMHDNLILPDEPCGFLGGRPNVDLGNIPVFLRTNEVRDGGIHALTCITPDTKETSLYYWRDPYLERLSEDEELDLLGVLFVGSPQANTEKFYVSKRVGATVEAINPDGVIITTEGFGNNHVDFASHVEQIGMLGIPVVACSYCGIQGALVVGNKYMDTMVDHCVTDHGNVEDILQLNTGTQDTALRAVTLLKNRLAGVKVNNAERKYNPALIEMNQEIAQED
ncbi:MAG: D-proline reductase (dithiol) proprotein PrdA [Clostridiales bacterium]|nr:D-proline reductase (dithiol) proprotein PrdA [Clostridiales bacterium]